MSLGDADVSIAHNGYRLVKPTSRSWRQSLCSDTVKGLDGLQT